MAADLALIWRHSNFFTPMNTSDQIETVIQPPSGWLSLNLRELWRYRDLLTLLAWRDISARFRQSIVGYGWAILRPLITAVIYTLVFSFFVRIETTEPYILFAFSALIPWMYFSGALTSVVSSVVGSSALLTKVYFPRLVLPLSTVAVGMVEVFLQLIVLGGLMIWYQFFPGWQIIFLPFFIAVVAVTALAFGIWLTALNVRYRDVGMAVPFVIQIWMYLCPIVYPISLVPERFQAYYALNPLVGVIEGFRWCLLGSNPPNWTTLAVSCVALVVILVSGIAWFKKVETTFADVI